MVVKREMKEVDVRYCDFCGKEAKGVYSQCDYCHRDICNDHYSFTANEEECKCVQCAAKEKAKQLGVREKLIVAVPEEMTVGELDAKMKKLKKENPSLEVFYDGDRKKIIGRG
jgi:hypothetical protein